MTMKEHSWIKSTDVLSIFPTFVWKVQLRAKFYEEVNKSILTALNRMRRRSSELTPGKAWQSNQEIHKLEEFRDFILYVNDTVKTALQFLKIDYDAFEITGCWVNINAPGTSHRIHSHPNNFLSGVYYVQTQTGAGTINFHDPRIQTNIIRPPVTKLTAGNTDQVVVSVRNGTLLVFPSYLQHSVDPNKSDEERISVSFNIMFSSFTENLSKPLW